MYLLARNTLGDDDGTVVLVDDDNVVDIDATSALQKTPCLSILSNKTFSQSSSARQPWRACGKESKSNMRGLVPQDASNLMALPSSVRLSLTVYSMSYFDI